MECRGRICPNYVVRVLFLNLAGELAGQKGFGAAVEQTGLDWWPPLVIVRPGSLTRRQYAPHAPTSYLEVTQDAPGTRHKTLDNRQQ